MGKEGRNTPDGRKWDKAKVLQDIMQNYRNLEKSLVKQLFFVMHNHGVTVGGLREDIWKSLFEQIVPKKFKVERSVFIIDSNFDEESPKSGVSKEVDIAIFDESYTPYIFQFGRIKFIPIEAVAAVVECKSTNRNGKTDKDRYALADWVDSIKQLKTCANSIARMATNISVEPPITQTATRPVIINCYLENKCDKGETRRLNKLFDIVLRANEKEEKIYIELPNPIPLKEWFVELNLADQDSHNFASKNENMNQFKIQQKKDDDNYDKAFLEAMDRKLCKYTVKYKDSNDEISLLSFNFICHIHGSRGRFL